jgi:hypothetical protein
VILYIGANLKFLSAIKGLTLHPAPQILNFRLTISLPASQNTRKLHEDTHKLALEQKSEIERLSKKEAESEQIIEVLEERLKVSQGMSPSCF